MKALWLVLILLVAWLVFNLFTLNAALDRQAFGQTIRKDPLLESWSLYDEKGRYQGKWKKSPILDQWNWEGERQRPESDYRYRSRDYYDIERGERY